MKNQSVYERSFITCGIVLFVCVFLKLFGVEWFDLNTDIEILQRIDNIVMNSEILSFIYSFIFTFISSYLWYAITVKTNFTIRSILMVSVFVIISMFIQRFLNVYFIPVIFDILGLYVICILFDKHSSKEFIYCFLINLFYQTLSLILRDLKFSAGNYGATTTIILNLDYYIMLMMTYLYLKKGDKTLCGIKVAFYSFLKEALCGKLLKNCTKNKG